MNEHQQAYAERHIGKPYRAENGAAQDEYARAHADAMRFLEKIRARLEDADAPSERTHWGDVADMHRIALQLREIVEPAR